jgi:endonuclease III
LRSSVRRSKIFFEASALEEVLSKIPSYSQELGLDLRAKPDRFKWFIASMLYAKRISSKIASATFRKFSAEGLVDPQSIASAGWDKIVEVLDSGGYVRYDFSTATNILESVRLLLEKYGGDVDQIHERASDPKDLEERLMEFRGFGPVAVNIFLRELRGIWSKADPEPSSHAKAMASRLGLSDDLVRRYESQLVRLYIEYCKRGACERCPVQSFCPGQQ